MTEAGRAAARTWAVRAVIAVCAVAAIAGVAALLQRSESSVVGPHPIAWGEEPCAHCRMLVSDPRYAAQLVLPSGEVKNFDDPGCLLAYEADVQGQAAITYFHHSHDDRWLTAPMVAFERGAKTPMGHGFAAVDPGTAGAFDLATVRQTVARGASAHAGAH